MAPLGSRPLRRISRTSARSERGQNLIEFALLAPFVIAFIAIIVVLGLALNTRSSLQQAVREGARQASVGKSLTDVQNLASGNAPEVLSPSEVQWCHPMGTGGTQGKVGDPVRVYVVEGGTEGIEYTLVSAGGIFSALGVPPLTVRMGPRATARLEKSVSIPVDCL